MTRPAFFMAIPLLFGGTGFAEQPPEPRAVSLNGLRARLHAPVLVARSKGYLWFPCMHRLSDGALLAVFSNHADADPGVLPALLSWSSDGGKSWSPLQAGIYGGMGVLLANGDHLLLPYNYLLRKETVCGNGQIIPKAKREIAPGGEVVLENFPRHYHLNRPNEAPDRVVVGFLTTGHVLAHPAGGHIATFYGRFDGDGRLTLITMRSADGNHWKYYSEIAGPKAKVPGKEGPNEAAMCRLQDGRLLCVFRHGSGDQFPFAHCFSPDSGKTWTEPTLLPQSVRSVKPSLAMLPDGLVALTGGRPGIALSLNLRGDGKEWQTVDLIAHHNATVSQVDRLDEGKTSSYSEVVAIDARTLVVLYDRMAFRSRPVPRDSPETNSAWAVRVEVER